MGRAFEVRKAAMAKTSLAKAKVYSRFGREIYMAAKAGIPDIEMNSTLKRTVEKARANQVPAEVIKRAIDKAKGAGGESYESARYEGFGPGASTIIIDCLTDNTNRTIADIRACFNKSKAKLAVSGAVSHAYDNVGLLSFAYSDEDKMLETLIEHEVDVKDIECEEGMMTLYVDPTSLYLAKDAVESIIPNVEFQVLEITYLAQEYTVLAGEELELFQRLVNLLDEVDDVQNLYYNVQL